MSNNKQSILLNGYWVIGTNKWDANIYTQDQSEKYAKTLFNCSSCIDCRYCRDCSNCSYCRDCRNCSYCRDCSDCFNCSSCIDCRDCRNCSNCSYCRDCRNCSYCSGFTTNPERITSPILGSRKSQTTYYWNDEKEQIVCGCFKGTLEELEAKIKEKHGQNEYAQGYHKWIEKVKIYRQNEQQ